MKADNSPDLLYHEIVKLTGWVWGLIAGVLIVLLGTVGGVIAAGLSRDDWIGLIIAAAIILGVGFVAWNYRAIEIKVTREMFEARYGLFNRTAMPLSEIEACQPSLARFGTYLGIGVRLGTDGSWAYTTSFGPAVELRRRLRRPFLVSSNRPQELCRAIREASKKTALG